MQFDRRKFLKRSGFLSVGAILSAVGTYQYGTRVETGFIDIERVNIPIKGLSSSLEGLRILLLSDFHLYPHTQLDFIERVVVEAQGLNPDLIALTGDFVQGRADAIFDLAPVLGRLNAPLGIFCVLGNHDLWKGRQTVLKGLKAEQLPVLCNEGLSLTFGRSSFYLAGVDDAWSGSPDLAAAMADHKRGEPVILLSHEPDPVDRYARDSRISLQLSGHSHGGQVRFPGLGSPFLPPYGQKYDMGLFKVGQTWLYTNRGIGVTVPIRLNCPPEITLVTITA